MKTFIAAVLAAVAIADQAADAAEKKALEEQDIHGQ